MSCTQRPKNDGLVVPGFGGQIYERCLNADYLCMSVYADQ